MEDTAHLRAVPDGAKRWGWADTPDEGEPAHPTPRFPGRDWPSLGQLTYAKEAITVLLLVLALPWLVSKLVTNPGAVLSGLGRRAANKTVA